MGDNSEMIAQIIRWQLLYGAEWVDESKMFLFISSMPVASIQMDFYAECLEKDEPKGFVVHSFTPITIKAQQYPKSFGGTQSNPHYKLSEYAIALLKSAA